MSDFSQILLDQLPELRDQNKNETTPEYLNYINETVNKAHADILQFSPFYKISHIFKTKHPLDLKDIKDIFNEIKKSKSL